MARATTVVAGVAIGAIGISVWSIIQQNDSSDAATRVVVESQAEAPPVTEGFQRVQRPGSVDIRGEYNLDGLTIPEEEIHTLLPRDAIPAITDPKLESIEDAKWARDTDRVIDVTVGDESVAVHLKILDYHEIVNMTVGGEPVAATYCPLCDSATVFLRRLRVDGEGESAEERVLEFGVSGALYNSNVLMYDRTDKALWSQLGMHAVSGPLVGRGLEHLPIRIVTFGEFTAAHPKGRLVSLNTGCERPYSSGGYARYFSSDDLLVPVKHIGDALPRHKTLGVGVLDGQKSWFVTADAIGKGYTLDVPSGKVELVATGAGVSVTSAPDGVKTVQTFYYSWSAFRPETDVIDMPAEETD